MKNKLFLATLAAAVAIPALVAPIQADAAVTFKDISKLDKASQEKIQTLVAKGIILGFTDETFRPSVNVTRGQYALFIARALDLPLPKKPVTFKDVTTQVSTYDGIIRAYEAGIVKGYSEDRFAPHETISRSQMAIMLDNALQYKASYPTKGTLKYTDSGSIGASALLAVQRLTHYGIMGGHKNGNSFAPYANGDRLLTVLSIHELMEVKGLLKSDVIVTPEKPNPDVKPEQPVPDTKPPGTVPYKPDSRDYTLAEMRLLLPPTTKVERSGDGSILITDMVEDFYRAVQKPNYVGYNNQPQKAFVNELSFLESTHQVYENAYPKYELVSINGIPYRYSKYYPEFLKNPQSSMDIELNELVAKPPTESGKFLIDIGILNQDVVTYTAKDIQIERATSKPILTPSKAIIADVKAVFKDTKLVSISSDGLTVSYLDNTLQMKDGSSQAMLNGVPVTLASTVGVQQETVLAPIQSVATFIGLSTRKLDEYKNHSKVEIANYELPVFTLGENNSITSYEGYGWER